MKFLYLEDIHKIENDILVIGKTIERDNKNYHIVGMTLADEAKLYIIEPYSQIPRCKQRGIKQDTLQSSGYLTQNRNEPENYSTKKGGVRNQRKILKEHSGNEADKDSYLHCSDFYLGNQHLEVRGGSGGSLKYSTENYEEIKLFFDMLRAGWIIPEWLKNEEWDNLQLVTLVIADMKKSPKYSSEMPVTIKHSPCFIQHIIEKTVTLNVGKSCSFRFVDNYGDTVQCYINNVTLIDMWKEKEAQFQSPRYTERFSEEQIQEMKNLHYKALEQSCPKGMCYIGIEYECSKELSLQFYTKEFLKSFPETHTGSAVLLFMGLKPDKETGTHGLPLKGCVIQTAVSPDTTKIPAELFLYLEKKDGWEETIQG